MSRIQLNANDRLGGGRDYGFAIFFVRRNDQIESALFVLALVLILTANEGYCLWRQRRFLNLHERIGMQGGAAIH